MQRPLAGLCTFLYTGGMNPIEEILRLLRAAKETVATAESVSVGYLQTMLGSVSGASDVFKGGLTAYWRSVKVDQLGVDDELAQRTDCVDEEIARQMALGAMEMFQSTYALATCGYAEQDEGKPHAFYAIAHAQKGLLCSRRIELSSGRIHAQQEAAQIVLDRFLELLRNKAGDQ